jgi:predicted nucleotidyltransferase
MREEIERRIGLVEAVSDVRVPLAAEAGSRLTKAHRPDSDYDVKGMFVRPAKAYLSLVASPESLRPDNDGVVDILLLDARRFIVQTAQGNPSALDVVFSPVLYRADPALLSSLKDLHSENFVPSTTGSMFLSLAFSAFFGALKREGAQAKEVGYAIRSIGRQAWTEMHGSYPEPGSEMELDEAMDDDLRWIDDRREMLIPHLDPTRFEAISGRIRNRLEAKKDKKDRPRLPDVPSSADEILFSLLEDPLAPDVLPSP